MQQVDMLFGPIVEVRDVLESYIQDHVRVPGWRDRLTEASRHFIELGQQADSDPRLVTLGDQIALLAQSDLETSPLTHVLAAEVERLVDEIRIPEMPRPEDDDWAF
jgi:hypothetical protein